MTLSATGEFAPETVYLDTAAYGLPPARALAAVRAATAAWAAGRATPSQYDHLVPELRAGYARLLSGAQAADVALGNSVGGLIGPVAAALPPGAEVLLPETEFASVPMPFLHRGDLAVRRVPWHRLIEEVRPNTRLVAVSAVQSIDGRIVDLPALHAATAANGAALLVDISQAAGWLPLDFADAEYWVCGTFKWLVGARSVAFFAAGPAAAADLRPVSPGWYAAADPHGDIYSPTALADTARRFDATPDWLGVIAAGAGLQLIEELTVASIGAHNLALADSFRAGLADLGYHPAPARSAIVAVPGAAAAADHLREAGIIASPRSGNLRFSFHLYNTPTQVTQALTTLSHHPTPNP